MADEYKPRTEAVPEIPWYYPQDPNSPCINMTDAEFSAYIKMRRKEFEDPATHCRHGYRLEVVSECYKCRVESGGAK